MRVKGKRRAVGMVGGHEHAPGIIHEQEYFQADAPLQGVDKIFVPVTERHHAAAGIAFDIHADPFIRMGMNMSPVLHHGICGGGDRLAEHDLTYVNGQVRVQVYRLCYLRRRGREFPVPFLPVTVELYVGQVHWLALGRSNGIERRPVIARHPQVAGMDVQRVGDADGVQRVEQGGQDGARRQSVMPVGFIKVQLPLVELERVDAAGVDYLDAHGPCCLYGPCHVVVDKLRVLVAL